MIAAHLGVIDEEAIDNMGFLFFEDILAELNQKLTYEAVSNYAGNGFFEKSWELISEHHPFAAESKTPEGNQTLNALAGLFGGMGPAKK